MCHDPFFQSKSAHLYSGIGVRSFRITQFILPLQFHTDEPKPSINLMTIIFEKIRYKIKQYIKLFVPKIKESCNMLIDALHVFQMTSTYLTIFILYFSHIWTCIAYNTQKLYPKKD